MKRALTAILSAVFLFYGCAADKYIEKLAERPANYEQVVFDRANENRKKLIEICKDKAYLKDPNMTQGQIDFYNATCRFYVDEEKAQK